MSQLQRRTFGFFHIVFRFLICGRLLSGLESGKRGVDNALCVGVGWMLFTPTKPWKTLLTGRSRDDWTDGLFSFCCSRVASPAAVAERTNGGDPRGSLLFECCTATPPPSYTPSFPIGSGSCSLALKNNLSLSLGERISENCLRLLVHHSLHDRNDKKERRKIVQYIFLNSGRGFLKMSLRAKPAVCILFLP